MLGTDRRFLSNLHLCYSRSVPLRFPLHRTFSCPTLRTNIPGLTANLRDAAVKMMRVNFTHTARFQPSDSILEISRKVFTALSSWYDRQKIGREQIKIDEVTNMINIIPLDNIFSAESNLAKKIVDDDKRLDFHLGNVPISFTVPKTLHPSEVRLEQHYLC